MPRLSRLLLSVIPAAGLLGPLVAQTSTHGDVSARLSPIGNPLVDFGYRTSETVGGVSYQSASTSLQDTVFFAGRLLLAYGDSSGGGGSKLALAYQPDKGIWWFENEESQRWDEEQLDHFREYGGEVYLHSYDGITPGNQLYIRSAGGWRVIDTGLGDHMRDTARFGDRIWTVDASTGAAFPRLFSAPYASPSGAFTRFVQSPPMGFTDIGSFLAESLFEFNGVAYASAFFNTSSSFGTVGKFPWLISLNHSTPGSVWQVAHANPLDTFFPASTFAGYTGAVYVDSFYETVQTPGKFTTDATGAPRRNMLLFINTRLRTDGPATTRGLWVADGITSGERRLVPLSGLPTNTNLTLGRLIQREGRVFLGFTDEADYGATDRSNRIWVYELTDPDSIDAASGWTLRLTAALVGLSTRQLDFASGVYYFGTLKSQNASLSTTVNPGYSGSGHFLVFNPLNQPPVVTRTSPSLSGSATFNTTVASGSPFTVGVTATDPDAGDSIASVRLYSEGHYVADLVNSGGAAWSVSWLPPAPGLHRLQVVAEDSRGARTNWGRLVNLTVSNAPPSASITYPTAGLAIASGSPKFTVSVSDADSPSNNRGSPVARVVWKLNGRILGESTAPPFSFDWTQPSSGPHSLVAVVTDTDGATGVSPAVSFTYSALELPDQWLPPATIGTPYSASLAVAGGAGMATFAMAPGSTLPAGLSLSSGGLISGIPSAPPGRAHFSVLVTDSSLATAQRELRLDVSAGRLLAYESFEYTPESPVVGRAGGVEWTSAWTSTTSSQNTTIAQESLVYTDTNGARLLSRPGRLQHMHPTAATGVLRTIATGPGSASASAGLTEILNAAPVIGADGLTVYISFLMQVKDPRSGNYQVELRNNAATSISGLRIQQDYRAGRLNAGTFSNSTALGPIQSDVETKFIVIRVNFGASNVDSARFYLNPTLSAEPAAATVNLSGSSFAFDRIFVGDGGTTGWSDGRELALDEVRVGTTWAEVTPHVGPTADAAPTVLADPSSLSLVTGARAVFTVLADGRRPLSYQWRRNGVPIPGATRSSLEIWSATTADAGRFDVLVTNASGTSTSSAALLSVAPLGSPAAPAALGVTSPLGTTVSLSWRAALGASTYRVLRGMSPTGPFVILADSLTGTIYTDTSAVAGVTSHYRIEAATASGLISNPSYPAEASAYTETQAWRQQWFGSVENAGPGADLEDPDGDGLVNVLEYGFGSSPLAPGTGALPNVGLSSSGRAELSFTPLRSDLTYIVEGSSNLISWTPLLTVPGGGAPIEFVDEVQPAPSRFLRVRMER